MNASKIFAHIGVVITMWCFLWIATITLVAIALFAFANYLPQTSPSTQVRQELERLKKMGEPTDWRDIIKPVPAHLDGTPLYRKAFVQLEAAQRSSPTRIWHAIARFGHPTVNLSDIRKGLKLAQPALQTFRKALDLPHMRLVDWHQADKIGRAVTLLPKTQGITQLRPFARLLRVEALMRKHEGNVDGAVESCLAILKLGRMSDEPNLTTFMNQGIIFEIGLETLQQVLRDANASPQVYRQLLVELQSWDIDRNFVQVLKLERILNGIAHIDMLQSMPSNERLKALSKDDEINLSALLGFRSYLVKNQLAILRNYTFVIDIASKGAPYDENSLKQLEQEDQKLERSKYQILGGRREIIWHPYELAEIFSGWLIGAFKKAIQFHALQKVTMTAVALRLYRCENGCYPNNLQKLVPKYLPKVPIDPFDGKPLKYRKLTKGFKVWSVGANGKDEGRTKVRDRFKSDDIVFRSER